MAKKPQRLLPASNHYGKNHRLADEFEKAKIECGHGPKRAIKKVEKALKKSEEIKRTRDRTQYVSN